MSYTSEDHFRRSLLGSIINFKIRTPKFQHEQQVANSSATRRAPSSSPFDYDMPCSSRTTLHQDAQARLQHQNKSLREELIDYNLSEKHSQNLKSDANFQFQNSLEKLREPLLLEHSAHQHDHGTQSRLNYLSDLDVYGSHSLANNISLSEQLSESLFLASPSETTTASNSPTGYSIIGGSIGPASCTNHSPTAFIALNELTDEEGFSSMQDVIVTPPSLSKNQSGQCSMESTVINSPQDIYKQIVYECEPMLDIRRNNLYTIPENAVISSKSKTVHYEQFDEQHNQNIKPYLEDFTFQNSIQSLQHPDSSWPPCYQDDNIVNYNYDTVSDRRDNNIENQNIEVETELIKTIVDAIASEILQNIPQVDVMPTAVTASPATRRSTTMGRTRTPHQLLASLFESGRHSLEELVKMIITAMREASGMPSSKNQHTENPTVASIVTTAIITNNFTTTVQLPQVSVPENIKFNIVYTTHRPKMSTKPIKSNSPTNQKEILLVRERELIPPLAQFTPQMMPRKVSSITSLTGESPEEILQRKRQQNNDAAARYRKRQRHARVNAEKEIDQLQSRNKQLRADTLAVEREINELKRQFIISPQNSQQNSRQESAQNALEQSAACTNISYRTLRFKHENR